MHSRVFLTIDSFMVHDNPRPRNQSQKSKVDWCLETDRIAKASVKSQMRFSGLENCICLWAFYRRLSWALSVSRNLRLYAIFIKESHRNTRIFSQNQTSILAVSDKPTAKRHMPKCILGGWINAFG